MPELKKRRRTKRRPGETAPELEPVLASSHPLGGERSKRLRQVFWALFAVLSAITAYGIIETFG